MGPTDFLWSSFFVETEHASTKTPSVNSFCVDFGTTFRYRKDFFTGFFDTIVFLGFLSVTCFLCFNWVSCQGEGRALGPREPVGLGAPGSPLIEYFLAVWAWGALGGPRAVGAWGPWQEAPYKSCLICSVKVGA